MADLIDRQAAIDTIAKQMPKSYTSDGSHPGDEEIYKIQEIYVDCIESIEILPAAQPDHNADIGKKVCVDTISRQAAIDALDVLCQEHRYKIPGKRETYSQYNEAWQDALDRAEGAIFNLPSAQPDHVADVSKKVSISCSQENDLISRQATIDLVGDWIYNPEDLRYHKDVINSIPAAQPEIVRCKDCKHWDTEWSVSESGVYYCPMVDGNRNSDFYCADAERRTDDKTNKGSSC